MSWRLSPPETHSSIVTVVIITGAITENLSQRTFVNRASGFRVVIDSDQKARHR
jgi:hypothetical protein